MTVTHSVPSSLGSSGRNVRFLHAAFDKAGDCFVAGDHHGNVFAFDLVKNRLVDLCRMVCWHVAEMIIMVMIKMFLVLCMLVK